MYFDDWSKSEKLVPGDFIGAEVTPEHGIKVNYGCTDQTSGLTLLAVMIDAFAERYGQSAHEVGAILALALKSFKEEDES